MPRTIKTIVVRDQKERSNSSVNNFKTGMIDFSQGKEMELNFYLTQHMKLNSSKLKPNVKCKTIKFLERFKFRKNKTKSVGPFLIFKISSQPNTAVKYQM